MIQFNLLPDVKLHYIRAQRAKHTVMVIALMVSGTALAVLVLLFMAVGILQKKHLKDLNKDIKANISKLEKTPDLNKILTIQNQLKSLPALHDQKPVTTRLFGYLGQVTPANINISKLDVDFDQHTIAVSGTADSLSTINLFVDTLKFTTYTSDSNTQSTEAFSSVVLESFGKSDKDSDYKVGLIFDPAIFDSKQDIKLLVPPNKITTRSETEKPADLFQASKATQGNR